METSLLASLFAAKGNETNIYAIIAPLVIGLILLEIIAARVLNKRVIRFQEAVMNFGTQLCNQTTNVLLAVGVLLVYGWLWQNYRLIDQLQMNWLMWIALFLGIDFIFYWVHRWAHAIKIGWAAHSPHHSAEEMNFFVALRASVTMRLFSFLFFWPLVLIGFRPEHIVMMTGIHLFQAFLHHTELVPKLWKPIEFLFTTPSHHRVHHGMNFAYLDKNFGEFLIIWDRLFGTFAEEKEKVVYGMYHHPRSWNPLKINFNYYQLIWRDAVAAPRWWDKLRIWFMPLDWTPPGVTARAANVEVTPANQQRFETTPFAGAQPYLIVHAVIALVLTLLVIKTNSPWDAAQRAFGAALLWHGVLNWSGILEARRWLFGSEVLRLAAMAGALLTFSAVSRVEAVIICVVAAASMLWAWRYFRAAPAAAIAASS
jgi:alkylglycerol monooxygenase